MCPKGQGEKQNGKQNHQFHRRGKESIQES